ncbi:hypothetical protein [Desulfonema ishimotonii]|uniref:hypothetical protein n=1 Tax=Desulfonema ishimotonii TaxID=45657 RepID=UPI000F561965|nr:hypothetical protein [Desulfonema ishimotonii]
MKNYRTSLNIITSPDTNIDQVAQLLGTCPSNLTHRIIDIGILWQLKSDLEANAFLSEHIKSTISFVSGNISSASVNFIKKIYFDIVIFYDTFTCSLSLENKYIKQILSINSEIDIEISCYPTDDNS